MPDGAPGRRGGTVTGDRMESGALRDTLEAAGLSQYQADAYVTLVELGSASAVELSDACSVPQARIYDVLRDLEDRGYVETYEHGSLEARAHEPSAVVEDLQEQAAAALSAAEEIEQRWERPAVERHSVSVVNRFETVLRRAEEYVSEATSEIQLSATVDQFRELADELAAAQDRDVLVELSLHPRSGEESIPGDVEQAFPGTVTEVRHRRFPSPFLLLVDRTSVCFSPEVVFHPANEYGMVINDYSLGHVFEQYFQTVLWEGRDVVFAAGDAEPPLVFTRVRECIRELLPAHEAGADIAVRVTGRDRGGDEVAIEGTVADLIFEGPDTDRRSDDDLPAFADQATIVVDDGGERYQVGGYGAVLEDVEAHRIVVEEITGDVADR
ncbi:TrmB family transcriptional regulator [Halobacteriaceae archaeon GCM10025711]